MAYQPEQPQYDAGVYQLETTDPVDGGVGAVSNSPLLNLANRTAYLKQHVDNLESGATIPPTLAPLNSPALTGSPTAPTAPLGDDSTLIATDAFVQGTVNGVSTINVAGNSNVALTAVQAGVGILVFTGALTGNISVIVPATSGKWEVSNQTTGAYTLTVKTAAGTGVAVTQGKNTHLWCDGTNVNDGKSDFVNTALTGQPTAPTPASGDNSTNVATTAFSFNATDGLAQVNVAGNSNVALTQAQYGAAMLNLYGALTGNINLVFPQQTGQWIVANNSTGAFAITGKTTAGGSPATVVLPQGSAVIVYCDGTNMELASSSGQQLSFTRTPFSPAVGTTSLTVPTGYTVGNLLVEKNGALLEPTTDFTATDGSTIQLTTATIAGDAINVYALKSFTVANAVLKSGDVMNGPLALYGGDTGVTPALFDSSTDLSTTAFVQRALGNWSGTSTVNANGTIDKTYAGNGILIQTAGLSLTVSTTGLTKGARFNFFADYTSGASATLNISGGGNFVSVSSATMSSVTLNPGDQLSVTWDGSNLNIDTHAASLRYSAGFSAQKSTNGYQKLPSGLIIQWGSSGVISAGGTLTITLPISFPNACLNVSSNAGSTASNTPISINPVSSNTTSITLANNTASGSYGSQWIAIGY